MGLSEFYGEPTQESEAINLLHRAVDLGITHFDTAEIYGQGRNEQLLGRAFAGRWRQIVLATKFGPQRDPATGAFVGVDGSPANVRASCERSLQRLGTEKIDLYYLHRVDPAIPIEDTVGEMAKLVQEGKIGAIGLSEASAKTIERANAVHPIAALQTEYSIFSRDIEQDILPTCVDLGIKEMRCRAGCFGLGVGPWESYSSHPRHHQDRQS
jgi:aryl-alcohol dehydrogenase-like predicted oxidoreductase